MSKFTYYNKVQSQTPYYYSFSDLPDLLTSNKLYDITDKVIEDPIKNKTKLPIIYPSAIIPPNVAKENDNVIQTTGYIWYDIDLKDNDWLIDNYNYESTTLSKIKNDPFTYMTWFSLNKGLRILIKSDNSNIKSHLLYWNQLKDHYQNHYHIKVDPKCYNIARGCFINYQLRSNIYVNNNSDIYSIDNHIVLNYLINNNNNNNLNNNELNRDNKKKYHISSILPFPYCRRYDTFSENDNSLLYQTFIPKYEDQINDKRNDNLYVENGYNYCKLSLYKDFVINDGERHRYLGMIVMKLLYLNPDVTVNRLTKEVYELNKKHFNPVLDPEEVKKFVSYMHKLHRASKMDYSNVIERRTVYYSINYINKLTDEQTEQVKQNPLLKKEFVKCNKRKHSLKAIREFKTNEYQQQIYDIIEGYQGKKRLTYKIIADKLNVSLITVKRYVTPELKEYMRETNNIILNK